MICNLVGMILNLVKWLMNLSWCSVIMMLWCSVLVFVNLLMMV